MENNKQGSKALSARAVETMRPGDTDKADSGENVGLRVSCGATGVAAFTVKNLIDAYLEEVIEDRMIIDPKSGVRKRVSGSRKLKGQAEVRRTLYGDPVPVLGERPAATITRKDVVEMVKAILDRGAHVQAGTVLRELTAAYEYAIGMGRFEDDFANPALLAKASLKVAKVRLTPVKGKRVLSDGELKLFLAWLPGSGFSSTQKNIMRFTLWTAFCHRIVMAIAATAHAAEQAMRLHEGLPRITGELAALI